MGDGDPCGQPVTHLVWWNWNQRNNSRVNRPTRAAWREIKAPRVAPDLLCEKHADYWRVFHRQRRDQRIELISGTECYRPPA